MTCTQQQQQQQQAVMMATTSYVVGGQLYLPQPAAYTVIPAPPHCVSHPVSRLLTVLHVLLSPTEKKHLR